MPLRTIGIVALGVCWSAAVPAAKTVHSCAVVGDSIALGIAEQIPACRHNAKVGIESNEVIVRVDATAAVNVVSAGSNDPLNPMLRDNLERIRNRARRVIWILPIHTNARAAVRAVAAAHGDPTVSFVPADDRVHPQSYATLAQTVSAALP
jgi:hypothetical protein